MTDKTPTVAQLVDDARAAFAEQVGRAGRTHFDQWNASAPGMRGPIRPIEWSVYAAAFNNAITELTVALSAATEALADTARDNARRGRHIAALEDELAQHRAGLNQVTKEPTT